MIGLATMSTRSKVYVEGAYGSDFLTGGTASADSIYSGSYPASYGCDNNLGTRWGSGNHAPPFWWKYALASGVTKIARRCTYIGVGGNVMQNYTIDGSNDNSNWTQLASGQFAHIYTIQTVNFDNSTAFRYHRIYCTSQWVAGAVAAVEIEFMEKSPGYYI